MSEQNKQVELFKAVKSLAETTDESIVNTSALCRLLDIDNNSVRQRIYQTGCSTMEAIQYFLNKK
ncbi:TPA: hypothetical protein L1206_003612 [Escherichia coli]|uniref:hypothetical protein n=1 Tax=Escherichia coli TaxID=562 RepID=UPI000BE6044D|nr:hypothetical protein [Escherichia coli]HBN1858883.1 hypothetical protein [Escherichia coli]HBN2121159.1 hypothetical protein [Escherichia coli]